MRNLLIATIVILFLSPIAHASRLSIDVHSGYGILRFEEKEYNRGDKFESEFKHKAILLGLSGEYILSEGGNIYTGINADWAFGLKDREELRRDGVKVQENDMRLSMQFYELRIGYRNQRGILYYRFYLSGGWDGMRFKRDEYIWQGSPLDKVSIEEISLWKVGAGADIGFRKDKWFLEGRFEYFYYPEGETEDSTLPNVTFDTEGSHFNIALGLTHEFTKDLGIYFGGDYILQKLKGNTSDDDISWRTKLQILTGKIKLIYAF